MTEPTKGKRGFASLSPEQLREVSSKGGRGAPPEARSFSKDPALAREAARLGARIKAASKKGK